MATIQLFLFLATSLYLNGSIRRKNYRKNWYQTFNSAEKHCFYDLLGSLYISSKWGLLDGFTKIFTVLPFKRYHIPAANTSYDVFLTNHVNKKNKGQVLAWAQIAIMLSGIMAPIIGGIITKTWSFQVTVYSSFFLLIIGSIILILTPDEKFKLPYSPKKVTLDVIKIPPENLFLAEIGYFFWESIIWIVWPVFLMIILKDVVSMATLVGK